MPDRMLAVVLTMLTCLMFAACGGSGGASFPVDGSKTLSSLTADEIQKICDEMKRVSESRISHHDVCRATAVVTKVMTKGDAQKCQAAYDACLKKPLTFKCGIGDDKAFTSCGATVDEFETCYNALLGPTETFYNNLSCSMSEADLAKAAPTVPAACTSLDQQCPGLVSNAT